MILTDTLASGIHQNVNHNCRRSWNQRWS